MKEYDFHGMSVDDALQRAKEIYNRHVTSGQRGRLKFIHGYGSSGRGHSIGEQIRDLLNRHRVEFIPGELHGGNAGITYVLPGPAIPDQRPKRIRTRAPSAHVGLQMQRAGVTNRVQSTRKPLRQPTTERTPDLTLATSAHGRALPGLKQEMPSGPIRLYALAREYDFSNKEVVNKCIELGIDVKSHMSPISEEDAMRVLRALQNRG